MGNKNSRLQEYQKFPGQKPPGPLNRFKGFFRPEQGNSGITRSGMILPPTQPSNIYNLQFILDNPPPIIVQPQQNTSRNQGQLAQMTQKLIEYNKTWNFGNQSDGQPQSLLKKETYDNFLVFVTNLIKGGRNTSTQPMVTRNANAISFQDKKNIVREIHKLVSAGGNQLVNKFFEVKISDIFPNVPDVKLEVTLLGLAAIIGAEHIVIYLLMIGANPSITKTDNRDSATLMLSFQIGIYKLLQQLQSINQNYFIILPRILYILFLLGSIGEGVDLSAIFETNEEKINVNNSKKTKIPVKSSILNMLAQMPGNTSDETAGQTLQNGGSIPLLLEILEKNNSLDKPKFFKDVNSLETPYDLNVLYSALMNATINDQTKLKLTNLLVLKYNANITNVPTFIEKRTNVDIFDRIKIAISDIKFTNPQTKLGILEIFSASNPTFKDRLEKSGLLNNSNTNKNAKNKRLKTEVALLRQKTKLITNDFAGNLAALGVKSELINAQIAAALAEKPPTSFGANLGVTQQGQPQYPINPGLSQLDQPQIQPTGFGTSPVLSQQVLPQIQPTSLSPGKVNANTGQPNQSQKKRGLFSGLFGSKPNNKQQIPPIQSNTPQKNKGFFNGLRRFSLSGKKKNNKGLIVAQPALLSNSPPISLQSPILNTTTSPGLLQPVSPLSNVEPKPLNTTASSALPQPLVPLNTTTSSALLQPVSPLSSPPNIKNKQAGGKKIQMRTYHFLKSKKYSERAFIAERPIIAADNAYDFMKLHYDIGSKKITFTIHERVNNKKYKYTARTLKDGTNVIKSAK